MTKTLLRNPGNMLALLLAAGAFIWLSNLPSKSVPEFNIQEVEIQAAKALIEAGNAIVVDVRPKSVYEEKHIPGAISVPLEELKKAVPASLEAAKVKSVVVYCGDGAGRGPEGTYVLNKAGFPGAVNLKGGIHGWTDAGLPVKTG